MPTAVSPFQQHLAPQHQQHLPPPQHPQQQPHLQQNAFFPSLHLYPLNESFVPKQIALAPQAGRVKIGRQTNARTVPGERNGYFDSKVLSRQHAEIWEENGKIYIKDVKSSNGTFINGERLSPEGVESDPFELKTDDTVEFGIDIVGEDNKTIIHHKVAAKVFCIFGPEDVQSLPIHHQGNRRVSLQSQLAANQAQNSALGGMGAPRAGKSGLTFDHILSRLQQELAKSRETGSELNQLTGTMVDIQDTLGGSLPNSVPPYPSNLPPVRAPSDPSTSQSAAPDPTQLTALQSQLHDTQSTLQSHLDKIHHLEGYVAEQEALKRDISFLKDQIDERKREVEIILMQRRRADEPEVHFSRRRSPILHGSSAHRSIMEMDDDDDDDARSVATAVPEDRHLDDEDGDDERRRQTVELGRPRTPEPTGHMSDEEDDEERRMGHQVQAARDFAKQTSTEPAASISSLGIPQPSTSSSSTAPSASHLAEIYSQNAVLTAKLDSLSAQLDSAMELSRQLQSQASAAQSTIATLESKVGSLELYVHEQKEKAAAEATSSPAGSPAPTLAPDERSDDGSTPEPPAKEELVEAVVAQSKWDEWKERVEGSWKTERETWDSERSRLAAAVKEWERRTVDLEKKEAERREKEEASERRIEQGAFDDSDDDEADVEGSGESGFRDDKRLSGLVNGFTSKRIGKVTRRRKSHGKANGLPNGISVLPSPVSSPASSISSYAGVPRRADSPTLDHSSTTMNGKLPISPPNTSPRSRPESLAHIADGEDESTEEPGDGESSLGLVNGGISSSQSSLPSSAGAGEKSRAMTSNNSFVASAHAFAQRNGMTGNEGLTFAQVFGGDTVFPYVSAAAVVVVSMTAMAVVYKEKMNV